MAEPVWYSIWLFNNQKKLQIFSPDYKQVLPNFGN